MKVFNAGAKDGRKEIPYIQENDYITMTMHINTDKEKQLQTRIHIEIG